MKGIPSREAMKRMGHGYGRSRQIRDLWAAGCNFAEIQAALGVDSCEVSRTLRRPSSYAFRNREKRAA